MPLLPNHTPSVRTKGLSAPSLRPPRNPYKSVLHMPGVHCHLYLRQKYISSWLYRSAQPSLSTNYAFYRNSNPHSGAASVATLAVYWNNTKNFLLFSFRVVFFEHNTLVQDVSARGCVQIILKRSSFSSLVKDWINVNDDSEFSFIFYSCRLFLSSSTLVQDVSARGCVH
jgi:hypothetical protein